MNRTRLCCRVFPIVIIIISVLIAASIWYFDEGVHQLTFLTDRNEFVNFLGWVLFIAIIPIGLFYYFNDKEKYQAKSRQIALLGFLPAIILLVLLII
ncbi:MAG: hypothetical protein ABFS16_05895 [Bacteroidota bacterium]